MVFLLYLTSGESDSYLSKRQQYHDEMARIIHAAGERREFQHKPSCKHLCKVNRTAISQAQNTA